MRPRTSRLLQLPSVGTLLLWMLVPLGLTIYFSFQRYNLLYPDRSGFAGLSNYEFFQTDTAFGPAILNTLVLVGCLLVVTVVVGLALALLVDRVFPGRGMVRVLLVAPFFIMPTVNALMWKNMFMNPVSGLFAVIATTLGLEPFDWLAEAPLMSILLMLSWQWTPFAFLIFATAMQSLDREQMESALLDGAKAWTRFVHLILPHLARPIAVVIMIQTIFHLSVFAEIFVTTGGGPGHDSTTLSFMIFSQALLQFDAGVASAGGVFAIILANIVAIFLIRLVGKSLVV